MSAGNCVHFEKGNCHVKHVRTGRKTHIAEKNGTFEIGIWVPKKKGQQVNQKPESFQRQG